MASPLILRPRFDGQRVPTDRTIAPRLGKST